MSTRRSERYRSIAGDLGSVEGGVDEGSVIGVTTSSGVNPDTLLGSAEPIVELIAVDGARIYTEVRGSGAPVLLIGAADEDAEVYRGIAERLAEFNTVVTYDRRGTGRSDPADWPSDSARHADDAVALITNLNLKDVVVLGASAGGIVALRLALRSPDPLKAVLCYEPGIFGIAEGGELLRRRVERAVIHHLVSHPGDWRGAIDALGREAVGTAENLPSLFTPPPGKEWFVRRTDANAESLIRGDLPLTRESFDPDAIADCPVTLRFSHGTASLPIFGAVAIGLADLRNENPDVLEGAGHSIFYHPNQAAEYIRVWASAPN
ncbi:MAG TPA: alpha/beta hydrolase [Acidimicrobiia bacterium]|nr:alpha/beta hydrolase [Acidimicrobiia bacterium]